MLIRGFRNNFGPYSMWFPNTASIVAKKNSPDGTSAQENASHWLVSLGRFTMNTHLDYQHLIDDLKMDLDWQTKGDV